MSLSDGIVFGCLFDEVSGDRRDYVRGAIGTDGNTVGSTAGKIGLAARFVQANSEDLNFGALTVLGGGAAQSWAMCGFTRWTNAGGSGDLLVTKDASNARNYQIDRSAADTLRFIIFNGSTTARATVTATVPTSGWFWWAVYFDKDTGASGTAGIRIDGGAFTTGALSASAGSPNTGNVRVGSRDLAGGTYLDGDVDLLYAWQGRVPSVAEFDAVYNGGAGLVIPASTGPARRLLAARGLG